MQAMATAVPNPRYRKIRISDEELRTGRTELHVIQAGVEDFHKNGFVVLENAIPHVVLDHIKRRMMQEIPLTKALPRPPYNHGLGSQNICQMPPLSKEFIHEELWANRHAVAVMENMLGPRPVLCFADSNIALPRAVGRQPVHDDSAAAHPDSPFAIEVFIYLDDVSSENGGTELWPATHNGFGPGDHNPAHPGWIRKEIFDRQARISPPFQVKVPKGSICMRDVRLWHAGMPNKSAIPRIMLGFMYFPRWFNPQMRLTLPRDTRELVKSWEHIEIMSVTDFVDGEVDHIAMRPWLNFSQEPSPKTQWIPRDPTGVVITPEDYWKPPG